MFDTDAVLHYGTRKFSSESHEYVHGEDEKSTYEFMHVLAENESEISNGGWYCRGICPSSAMLM